MSAHQHVFLAEGHDRRARKTWAVISLAAAMMVLEIAGGWMFGSLALIADGLHMSTHAAAFLISALAYTYSRKLAHDPRFSFGTGKFGDLAGFTSAIILGMIALLIAYEAVDRILAPVAIHYAEALPIAAVGLAVNVVSAWLLHDDPAHHHGHDHDHHDHDHEDHDHDHGPHHHDHHAATHRDNNLRAAFIHVVADAAVSVLVIGALILGWLLGWSWLDPVVGIVGAVVIANWAYGLVRDTGAILLDMTPDRHVEQALRALVEDDGDVVADLHVWRLGPGHLGAIVAVVTPHDRDPAHYRARLAQLTTLSHLTVEVSRAD